MKRRRAAGPPSFALRGGAREFTDDDEAAHTAAQHAVDALLHLRALPRPALTQRAAAAALDLLHSLSRIQRLASKRPRPRRRPTRPVVDQVAQEIEDLQPAVAVDHAAQELEDLRRRAAADPEFRAWARRRGLL